MKITPKYGERIISLPAENVIGAFAESSKEDLIVLIAAVDAKEFKISELASDLSVDEADVMESLEFWKKKGVISFRSRSVQPERSETASNITVQKTTSTRIAMPRNKIPEMTTDEFNSYIAKNRRKKAVIQNCEKALGKLFNADESKLLVDIIEYYNLSDDYIQLLCSYCAEKNERPSLHIVQQNAFYMNEKGIITYQQLEDRIKLQEKSSTSIEKIRKLIGMSDSKMSPNQIDSFNTWLIEWQFSYEMIEKAYYVMIDSIGKYNIKYLNKVLSDWHDNGIKTVADAEKYISENKKGYKNKYKNKKEKNNSSAGRFDNDGSFDTDDFFKAAINRSFKD